MLAAAKTSAPGPADGPDGVQVAFDPSSFTPYLCYACHATFTSRGSSALRKTSTLPTPASSVRLPVWIHSSLTHPRDSIHLRTPELARNGEDPNEDEVWRARRVERTEMREGINAFLLEHEDEEDD